MNKQPVSSNVSILSASVSISTPTKNTVLQSADLEFDFGLCHSQYSYCSCWLYR